MGAHPGISKLRQRKRSQLKISAPDYQKAIIRRRKNPPSTRKRERKLGKRFFIWDMIPEGVRLPIASKNHQIQASGMS